MNFFRAKRTICLATGAGAGVGAEAEGSRTFLPGAGADPIWSETESAPGPIGLPEPPKKGAAPQYC